ncbi:hypothetical protein B0J13DRAFT_506380 [Dactylonectria estremocensis]|uniref:Peroxisomal short-chain alcohol dehydrogenase n=1 Tax=Dactylonectria estremocensis TaxID=1079267 RepID=A0A9P9IZL4_9HYPO|nr:hypothetical protein B0J13DRAFT_506380 [Dactylonectria estremocensis]
MFNGHSITIHNGPYDAISPLRPELSQAGKTVLICGGSTGIGHAIARNFCEAGASKLVILGRRSNVLQDAVSKLREAHPNTEVIGQTCDVFERTDSQAAWDKFEADGVLLDVLVLNAVHQPALQPILEQGTDRLWQDFEANVRSSLYIVERFYKQPNHTSQKYCVSVSTQSIHRWDSAPQMPGYMITKNSFTCVLQEVARDTSSEAMQILSFHPSIVFTEAAAKAGYTKDTLPWTDENLPGRFAVWAASPEAKFLHGRFVWSNWDVTELATNDIKEELASDPWLLKVGVKGL